MHFACVGGSAHLLGCCICHRPRWMLSNGIHTDRETDIAQINTCTTQHARISRHPFLLPIAVGAAAGAGGGGGSVRPDARTVEGVSSLLNGGDWLLYSTWNDSRQCSRAETKALRTKSGQRCSVSFCKAHYCFFLPLFEQLHTLIYPLLRTHTLFPLPLQCPETSPSLLSLLPFSPPAAAATPPLAPLPLLPPLSP